MLQQAMYNQLPFDREIAFTDAKGRHKPSLEKKQRKLAAKAAPLLAKVLEPDEKVHLVTSACSPYSALEFFTTGWIIQFLKRCLLVVTDRRILHLPTNTSFGPRMSIAEVRYEDASEIKITSFLGRKLAVTYHGGKKEQFTVVPGWAAQKLKVLLPSRANAVRTAAAGGRRFLCPSCTSVLAADRSDCAGCGLQFKDRKTAMKYSILFPGGGYFYTRHPFLGIGDALFETFLIVVLVVGIGSGLSNPETPLTPEDWTAFGLLAVLLVVEKLITIYHAHHYVAERIPADRDFSLTFARQGRLTPKA
jgi:hypothetical protein